MMQIIRYTGSEDRKEFLKRPAGDVRDLTGQVAQIIEDVRMNGDEALKRYELRFDKAIVDDIRVSAGEIKAASEKVGTDLKEAIATARMNIESFHRGQVTAGQKLSVMPGVTCWQKTVAIERVGLYVPGGSAPLVSTVLMLGIPAVIAGCREIFLCTPPDQDARIHPAILYAAGQLGIDRIYRAGGVQAIAAMAYGTETIPAAYKIFGPGNAWVDAAKQVVARDAVAVDLPAGPSELAVIADDSADPAFIASDLLSQAEHGPDSQVLLFTLSEKLSKRVLGELEKQVRVLERREVALQSLKNSRIILAGSAGEIISLVNEYAPEHLIINTMDNKKLAEQIVNAGSVFLGPYTPESAGDYASGTNHTLPTGGWARAYSGLGTGDFMKRITFQEITREGLQELSRTVIRLAREEGLTAHAGAVSIRLEGKLDGRGPDIDVSPSQERS